MKNQNSRNEHTLTGLISEYEAMSQKGTVGFYEKTVFSSLVDHYLQGEQFEKALGVIEYALAQHPFSVDFHIRKAQIFLEKNCELQALESLDRAVAYAPAETEIQLLRAEAFNALGYYKDAFELLDNLKVEAPRELLSEIYLTEALIYENQAQFEEMFYALKRSILAKPENPAALTRIWFSVEMSRLYKESINLHQKLIDIDAYNYVAWYNLGYAYAALEDHENARDAFEYAYLINEEFEFAYRHCAEACIQLGQYDQALKCFEDALEHIEPDGDLFLKIGYCYESKEDLTIAKSFYLKAIQLNPNNDCAYFRMGECFMQEDRWKSAISSYTQAMKLDERCEEYVAALAEAYYQMDNGEMAERMFRKAVETAPEISKYWIQYASFLLEVKEENLALTVLDEAELYTHGVELVYCRVACLLSLGRRKEGLNLFTQALREDFEMYDCLFDLMPVLEKDHEVLQLISSYEPR